MGRESTKPCNANVGVHPPGKEQPLSNYHHDSTKLDKHESICKDCQAQVDANTRDRNKSK